MVYGNQLLITHHDLTPRHKIHSLGTAYKASTQASLLDTKNDHSPDR